MLRVVQRLSLAAMVAVSFGCGRLGYDTGAIDGLGPDGSLNDTEMADGGTDPDADDSADAFVNGPSPDASVVSDIDPTCASAPPLSHAVALFPLDDSATPSAGSVVDLGLFDIAGECDGAGACPSATTGQIGTSLQFDGAGFVRAPVSSPADATATDSSATGYTVAVWFRPDELTVSQSIVAKQGIGSGNSYQILAETGGRFQFNTDGSGGRHSMSTDNFYLIVGQWTHVAVSWDIADGRKRIYVNGALDKTSAASVDVLFEPTGILIGADEDGTGPDNFTSGSLDDVRIYGRALDEAELQEIVACGG